MQIEVISFDPKYASAFYEFNIEWLETFFYVEEYDKEVLSDPDTHILEPGGHIFFAKEADEVLGTVALLKRGEGVYELTKMAVPPKQRGKNIGQILMQHCIGFAKEHEFKKLFLYSNTKLKNAIYIYRKYGFIEVPVETDSPYKRSNIKMEFPLS